MEKVKHRFLSGVNEVSRFINFEVLPSVTARYPFAPPATPKTVRRHFRGETPPRLPHKHRKSPRHPYIVWSGSVYQDTDRECKWCGFEELSSKTGFSVRTCKARVDRGQWKSDKVLGRHYFNPSSYHHLKK